jgi:DNA (cytosine-5)-methyltransferase 1
MNYLSVCSGVEAATVAWHHMGWNPVGFGEIEKFPSQVLAHHYPNVTNFGDMTKYKEWKIDGTIGLLVGGTPCQSFSVAGLRKGLEDPRGNLALTYVGILDHFRPKWFVWENVPGVLSSGGGRDFGSFLGAVAQCGYGFAYRVLDAQYFGVPQRRRRVFVVGCLGDWESAAKVLFEPSCLQRNTKTSRKKGETTTSFTASSFGNYSEGVGTIRANGGDLGGGSETLYVPDVANCLQTTCDDYSRADGFNMIAYEWHNQDSRIKPIDVAATLSCNAGGKEGHLIQTVYENHPSDSRVKPMGNVCQTVTSSWGTGGGNIPFVQNMPIALAENTIGRQPQNGGNGDGFTEGGPMYTLNATGVHGVAQSIGFTQCDAARDAGQDISPTLRSGGNGGYPAHAVAFGWQNSQSQSMSVDAITPTLDKSKTPAIAIGFDAFNNSVTGNVSKTLDTGSDYHHVPNIYNQSMAVRRLTPVECERLQGFPDNYTNIKENCPDGPRYKAMGNSMAVPVMRWIGERINKVNNEQ